MEVIHRHPVRPKKKVRATTREITVATFFLRCSELGLTGPELDEYSIGMIYDMCTEKANDYEKYPYRATQADIDKFMGEA